MASPNPLQGLELIDCAKANSHEGIMLAAERCGYGNELDAFEQALKNAGEAIGVEIQSFNDLNIGPNDVPTFPSEF